MEQKRSSAMSFVCLTVLAILLSIPIGTLSIFNFGLICRTYNGAIAIITVVFGFVFLFFWRRERRRSASSSVPDITLTLPSSSGDLQDMLKDPEAHFSSSAVFGSPFAPIDFPLANSMYTLTIVLGIAVSYIVGFAIMTDITIRGGAKSTLPAERDPKMTYPWNINIQIAQTAAMGVQMLVTLAMLVASFMGRVKVVHDEKEKREEMEYGLEAQ